ncbi:MAG: antibiotic biosynthesis monooxygenase [Armatimonadota bacterium]|nr:antibiotic biosynthesis monooxygenase [Armatimonadota bacterium]
MYLVVSYWEALPGHEAEFDAVAPKMLGLLGSQPGVVLAEAFKSNANKHVAVCGYESEAAHRAIVDDPQSEFNRALREHGEGQIARWLYSERGETFPHE